MQRLERVRTDTVRWTRDWRLQRAPRLLTLAEAHAAIPAPTETLVHTQTALVPGLPRYLHALLRVLLPAVPSIKKYAVTTELLGDHELGTPAQRAPRGSAAGADAPVIAHDRLMGAFPVGGAAWAARAPSSSPRVQGSTS